MAGSLRSTAMLVLLRFYEVASNTSVREFSQRLLMIAGAFSLLVATVDIWRSRDYKRLLAYSSVEHLGIITLSTGVGGAAMSVRCCTRCSTPSAKSLSFSWPAALTVTFKRVKLGQFRT
jgi:formate hydrogenlyase subunit 3/multisubunit Na+/H+ antiporter MnhD subunit